LNYDRIKNNVIAQDARFQQAVLTYRDTVLKANEEVENGIVSFLREQDRIASLSTSASAAARSVEIATNQYEKGVIDYQPLLDSQRVLAHQQDTLAEGRGLVVIHLVATYKALGGGWPAQRQTPSIDALSEEPVISP
jgi:outer membrane protein TolC